MIAVIGAGPAGLLCAKEAALNGQPVTVYEEHHEIGQPVQCTGLVSKKGLDALGVDYEESVVNKVRGARIFSPSAEMIEVKRNEDQAFLLDRASFDQEIAQEASAEGAVIVRGERVTRKKGDVMVAADGANSIIAKSLGLERNFIRAYQVTTALERQEDMVEMHFGSWAPHFFAWIVPESPVQCRVGVGVKGGNPKQALMEFVKDRKLKVDFEEELAGLIPVFSEQPTVFPEKNVLLVGDAAGQVKASTGGGIAVGGFCGRIAGEVLGRELPLQDYEKTWKSEFKNELIAHQKIHKLLSSLSSRQKDELFETAIEEGVAHIIQHYGDMDRPSKLIKHLARKPGLVAKLSKFTPKLLF
jgi:geranylgeranyl reductase family protein